MFKNHVNHCAKWLATDACYYDQTIAAFNSYECSLDDAVYMYQFVRDVIEKLDSDGETFYPIFYDTVFGDNLFKNLNSKCSAVPGFEVANNVLAHLNGTMTPESSFSKTCESVDM